MIPKNTWIRGKCASSSLGGCRNSHSVSICPINSPDIHYSHTRMCARSLMVFQQAMGAASRQHKSTYVRFPRHNHPLLVTNASMHKSMIITAPCACNRRIGLDHTATIRIACGLPWIWGQHNVDACTPADGVCTVVMTWIVSLMGRGLQSGWCACMSSSMGICSMPFALCP